MAVIDRRLAGISQCQAGCAGPTTWFCRWSRLTRTLDRALSRGVVPTVFTTDLFTTGDDTDNRAAVAAVPRESLDMAGIAVRADRKTVDKITAGLRLHP